MYNLIFMNRKEISGRSIKENAIALAQISVPLAILGAFCVTAGVGVISHVIATYQAEFMLGKYGLLGEAPVTDGFDFSKDGKEISLGLNISQKGGTPHHLVVIFPRDKVVETIVETSSARPSIRIKAGNIVKSNPLNFSPFSFPHSNVIDIYASDEVRLEGNVEVFSPPSRALTNSKNLK